MAEQTGNNSNQRGQDEHYKKTKKVTVYFYSTADDIPVRVSSTNPLPVSGTVTANTGASTPFVNINADIGVDTIKASAGVLCSVSASNVNTSDCIVLFYDTSGSVTVGVSSPVYVLFVPKGDGTNLGASGIEFPNPLNFANAIKYATVTTAFGDPSSDLYVSGSYI